MKTFLSDIFPNIQRFSEKLDDLTLLTNKHWVLIDDTDSNKTVYIFRANKELIISTNGKAERASWDYLGNKSILIDKNPICYLFKHGFFNENILALKVDNSLEYAVFVNENNFDGELDSINKINDFLTKKYLNPNNGPTNFQTVYRETNDNQNLKIISIDNNTIGAKVFINDNPAPNNSYTYIHNYTTHKLVVENGIVTERYYLEKVGDYVYEKKNFSGAPIVGDKIYKLNGEKVVDGKYRYSILFKFYIVENGIIIK